MTTKDLISNNPVQNILLFCLVGMSSFFVVEYRGWKDDFRANRDKDLQIVREVVSVLQQNNSALDKVEDALVLISKSDNAEVLKELQDLNSQLTEIKQGQDRMRLQLIARIDSSALFQFYNRGSKSIRAEKIDK